MNVYKMHFTSPLHLGVDGIDGQEKVEDMLRSDTIFSAVMANWGLLFDDDVEELCEKPPFLLSSAFPYVGTGRYYPVPVGMFDDIIKKDSGNRKFWKKVDFIPEKYILKFCKKGELPLEELDELKAFISEEEEKNETGAGGIYSNSKLVYRTGSERPRIGIDRLISSVMDEAFFYSRDVVFNDNCGLFFLVEYSDNSVMKKFDAVLRLLGDNGIGADRSIGRGQFVFSKEETTLKSAAPEKKGLLLSCYLPAEDEVKGGVLSDSMYNMVFRSGYVHDFRMRNLRKKRVTMLGEGSIISHRGRKGGIVARVCDKDEMDIPHNVYRDGRAFLLEFEGGA